MSQESDWAIALASSGCTTAEAAEGMERFGKVMYEITKEAIRKVADDMCITIEEAEGIYFEGIRNRTIGVDGKQIKEDLNEEDNKR